MLNEMETPNEQVVLPGNKEACKRYYERNAKSAKRRVLLNEISRHGRISTEATLAKWDITIHDIIEAFRKYKALAPDDLDKKLYKFRILVGNML